jgi:hypothetical protein
VARTPKWAQWQIDHPPPGFDPKTNRRFWRWMGIEVRLWLVWGAFMVLSALALLILLLLAAL